MVGHACSMWIGLRSQSHLRFGFDSTLDLTLPLFPSSSDGEGKGPVAGSRCRSIIVIVVGIFDSYYLCTSAVVVVYVCAKMEDKEASNSKETPTKKARRVCHYNVDWESPYDGLKAVTHHAEAKKHKEWESAAAMSSPNEVFLYTKKGSAQSEKVGIAELISRFTHSIKHHISLCCSRLLLESIKTSDKRFRYRKANDRRTQLNVQLW
ncbi:hypothetical protein TNCV_3366261 [Trichonephila clavipes]|nr:hypothetical protein TNCV_3366261 [Trichonephila clavipes]